MSGNISQNHLAGIDNGQKSERIFNTGSMPPDKEEMRAAAFELAKWLSAALDDESVCLEYKAAINSWFNAAMPSAHISTEHSTDYIMDAVTYYAENKDRKTFERIRSMVNEGELARLSKIMPSGKENV